MFDKKSRMKKRMFDLVARIELHFLLNGVH